MSSATYFEDTKGRLWKLIDEGHWAGQLMRWIEDEPWGGHWRGIRKATPEDRRRIAELATAAARDRGERIANFRWRDRL